MIIGQNLETHVNSVTHMTPIPVPGACDCHVHVIGPQTRYPLVAKRSYTPMDVTADDLIAMMTRAGLDRAVVVQPSVLGEDNSCTLDALPQLQAAGKSGRAVAVVTSTLSGAQLDAMHQAGVRGLRVNLHSHAGATLDQAQSAVRQAASLAERNGWHLQLFANRQTLSALKPTAQALGVTVVLDHFAGLSPDALDDADSQAVLDWLASGQAWLKLSGTYRVCEDAFDARLKPLAQHLARLNPERLVWASDWPHTPAHAGQPTLNPPVKAYRPLDTVRLRAAVHDWLDAPLASRVLRDNPARLYDFGPLTP